MIKVCYGDKIVPVWSITEGKPNRDTCTGIKIADKCEFLDNFEIVNVEKHITNYGVASLLDMMPDLCYEDEETEAEEVTLDQWHDEPDPDFGEEIEFTGKLYSKNVKLVLVSADHCDGMSIPEEGWVVALNMILDALYYYKEDLMSAPEYSDLPELHTVEHKIHYGFNCQYVAKLCDKYGKEKALQLLQEDKPETTFEDLEDYLVDYSNKVTIEDYMKSVDCDDNHYVEILVSRDKVVYLPKVKEM